MKSDLVFYAIGAIIVVVTFVAAAALPIPDTYRGLVTLPGLLSLFGIIIEAWRDKRAHERALDLASRQQDNALAIASHMASVVFDRQVAFCEAYFEKVYEILLDLYAHGPNAAVLNQAVELTRLRTKFAPWISPQMEAGLMPFENALRTMGASAQMVAMNLPQPDHSQFVSRMFSAFMKILEYDTSEDPQSSEEAISLLIGHLRTTLGVEQLTNLRDQAIATATIRARDAQKKRNGA